jgi:hypothetical protein
MLKPVAVAMSWVALAITAHGQTSAETLADVLMRSVGVSEESLAVCKYATGQPIEEGWRCKQWQSTIGDAKADRERLIQNQKKSAEESARIRAEMAADQEAKDRKNKEIEAKLAARRTEEAAVRAADVAEREQREAADAKETAQRKQICGHDYNAPRIGMPIKRAMQCITDLGLVAQINRRDGVVSRYEGNGYYVLAMGGKVVAWGED